MTIRHIDSKSIPFSNYLFSRVAGSILHDLRESEPIGERARAIG